MQQRRYRSEAGPLCCGKSYWYYYRPFLFMQFAWDLYATPAERGQTEIHNIGASSTRTTMTAELRQRAWKARMTAELRLHVPMRTLLRCLRKRMRWRMHCVCMRHAKPRLASLTWSSPERKNDSQAYLWLFRIARNILNKFPHHTDSSWCMFSIDLFSALLFEHASVSISIAFRVLAKPSMSFSVGAVLSPLLHELWTIWRSCEHILHRKSSCCCCANV